MYPVNPFDTAKTKATPTIPIEPAKEVRMVLVFFVNKFFKLSIKAVKKLIDDFSFLVLFFVVILFSKSLSLVCNMSVLWLLFNLSFPS